jgi:hypothetical protein
MLLGVECLFVGLGMWVNGRALDSFKWTSTNTWEEDVKATSNSTRGQPHTPTHGTFSNKRKASVKCPSRGGHKGGGGDQSMC